MMTEVRPGSQLGGRVPASAPEIPVDALWYSIPLNLASGAAIFVGASEASWLHIGKSALLAAGLTEIGADDARGTFLEIVNQATFGLAEALTARLEKPVAPLPAEEVRFPETVLGRTVALIPVEISLRDPPATRIYFGWSRALEQTLAPPNAATGRPAIERSRTLDLLMEVELPVSVSFGRAELPLREVLKLNSGSIVELNRTISDPVEIIVNNCVIARGEVVVVDGNYGVRIDQVISREERLRTLK